MSYDASGGEGVCSNRPECRYMREADLANRHITFIVVKKLNCSLSCSIYGIFGGRGLVENVIWGGEVVGWKR